MRIPSIAISMLALTVFLNAQAPSTGQAVYELPFASKDNTVELAVENAATITVGQVKVTVQNPPSWLIFKSNEAAIDGLAKGEEKTASFAFSVDKRAPVRKEQKLTFVITGPNNQSWTKEITVSVSPPERFELFQNYPNPFNTSSIISYQLTTDSRVILKVYNLLGQEVATLIDTDQTAGFHQERWNASPIASGTYIYRLVAKDASGKETVKRKTMTLLK